MAGVIAALGGGAGIAAIITAVVSVIMLRQHRNDPTAHGTGVDSGNIQAVQEKPDGQPPVD